MGIFDKITIDTNETFEVKKGNNVLNGENTFQNKKLKPFLIIPDLIETLGK